MWDGIHGKDSNKGKEYSGPQKEPKQTRGGREITAIQNGRERLKKVIFQDAAS